MTKQIESSGYPVRVVLTAVAFLAVAGCSESDVVSGVYSGSLYPGAGFLITADSDLPLAISTDHGMVSEVGQGRAWYHAPLERGIDAYFVTVGGKNIAGGEIEVSIPPPEELEITHLAGNEVSGSYGDVIFTASGTGPQIGHAVFALADEGLRLEVEIDHGEATMVWNGVPLEGYGPLTDAQAVESRDLSTSPLARALTMTALDLGCREEARQLANGAYAALLFPWQFVLKYEIADRRRVIVHFLEQSSCSFSGLAEEGVDEPLNVAVLWDANHVVPMTASVFPLDGKGQKAMRP